MCLRQTGIHEKKNGQASEVCSFDKGRRFHPGDTLPQRKNVSHFSSIMNKGDNSKPSYHFHSHRCILGAGHRDFLDYSLTGSKSGLKDHF